MGRELILRKAALRAAPQDEESFPRSFILKSMQSMRLEASSPDVRFFMMWARFFFTPRWGGVGLATRKHERAGMGHILAAGVKPLPEA